MKLVGRLLRIGLAFGFFYAAISGFISPQNWIGWLPDFIRQPIFLTLFEILELAVGFWLLSGYRQFWAATVSGLMLLGVVVFNFSSMDIVFRDVSLALAAFALAVLSKQQLITDDEHQRS